MAAAAWVTTGVIALSLAIQWQKAQRIQFQMTSWGMPLGSYEALPRLRSLGIGSDVPVNDLRWVSRATRLEKLILEGRWLSSLEGIPDNVSQLTLDLRGSQVSSLEGIPDNSTLDLNL